MSESRLIHTQHNYVHSHQFLHENQDKHRVQARANWTSRERKALQGQGWGPWPLQLDIIIDYIATVFCMQAN
jgi:hypothetical protein